ncbi:MAG: hypothetical protein MJ187_00395 [Alphaproteobacteria bacterium]|nr:hypothetical protein [Alphaproteobacteria bacterium]
MIELKNVNDGTGCTQVDEYEFLKSVVSKNIATPEQTKRYNELTQYKQDCEAKRRWQSCVDNYETNTHGGWNRNLSGWKNRQR